MNGARCGAASGIDRERRLKKNRPPSAPVLVKKDFRLNMSVGFGYRQMYGCGGNGSANLPFGK